MGETGVGGLVSHSTGNCCISM